MPALSLLRTALLTLAACLMTAPVMARDLVVALTPRAVSFSSLNDEGKLAGFNVDIAEAICRELGRNCELRSVRFPEILPATANGEVDIGVGNYLRTAEREREVAFTIPYWRSTTAYLAHQSIEFADAATTLAAHPVCVLRDSQQHLHLLSFGAAVEAQLVLVEGMEDLIDGMTAGVCPLAIGPTMQLLPFLQSEAGTDFSFAGEPLSGPGLGGDVHIIVRPDDPDLLQAVNRALQSLINSGEHERASRRYFPFSIL